VCAMELSGICIGRLLSLTRPWSFRYREGGRIVGLAKVVNRRLGRGRADLALYTHSDRNEQVEAAFRRRYWLAYQL